MLEIIQSLFSESWLQTASILGVTVGTFYYFHKDVKEEISAQSKKTDLLNQWFQEAMIAQTKRSDQLYAEFQESLSQQTKRTDRLYEMFIDLIKETRKEGK